MKIKKKYIVLFIVSISVVFCISTSYAQENYQSEFTLGYSSYEDDDNDEMEIYGLTAEIHFSEVDTTGHPYAEAAFLERVGSVELLVDKFEMEAGGSTSIGDGSTYGAMLTYMKPESPIAVQAMYLKLKYEIDSLFDFDQETDSYMFGIGYFLSEGLFASIGYSHSESDMTSPAIALDETIKENDYVLTVKYVNEQPEGTAINIEGYLISERV